MATKARAAAKTPVTKATEAKAAATPAPSHAVALNRTQGPTLTFAFIWAVVHLAQLALIGYFASLLVTDAASSAGSRGLASSAALIIFILSIPFAITLLIDLFGLLTLRKGVAGGGVSSVVWNVVLVIALVATGLALLAIGLVVAIGLLINPGFLRQ